MRRVVVGSGSLCVIVVPAEVVAQTRPWTAGTEMIDFTVRAGWIEDFRAAQRREGDR
jgi:hypothetical protein